MCQHSQHKFQNNDECSIENHGWTSISTFIIIILRQKHFLLKNLGSLSPIIVSSLYCIIGLVISTMASKFKGIYKSFKYITQMFGNLCVTLYTPHSLYMILVCFLSFSFWVWLLGLKLGSGYVDAAVKERELEIGYPTDVKHVAHIGWDGPSGNGPSWMNEFKTAPDFSTSLGNLGEFSVPSSMALTPSWSSQDFEESTGSQSTPNTYKGISSAGVRHVPMKSKRKKIKSTSSSESLSTSSRHLRAAKSKAEYSEREAAATIAQAKQIQDYADREKDLQCE